MTSGTASPVRSSCGPNPRNTSSQWSPEGASPANSAEGASRTSTTSKRLISDWVRPMVSAGGHNPWPVIAVRAPLASAAVTMPAGSPAKAGQMALR